MRYVADYNFLRLLLLTLKNHNFLFIIMYICIFGCASNYRSFAFNFEFLMELTYKFAQMKTLLNTFYTIKKN